jgi:pimeloyl-ACP methyl ester carboxylesterase
VLWLWIGLGIVLGLPLAVVLFLIFLYFYLIWRFMHHLVRIFEEKPLFIIPRGQPVAGAEEVRFPTADGLSLIGCYLRGAGHPARRRRGVILFGPEFGANRWSCLPYCEHLLASGFDLFAFDFRGQGESPCQPGYEPMQWVTAYEVMDVQAAVAYLRSRGDADPRGVGFFGISRGGSAGLLAASRDPYLRCFFTDGIFATYTTMVPYMRKWISIYSQRRWLQAVLPDWYYGLLGHTGLRRIRRERGCRFPHLERAISRLAPRPLQMVHGGADTYIKPEMAQALFEFARPPKEFWLVNGAKHNQAIQIAGDEYHQRVLDFFLSHLAEARREDAARAKEKPEVMKQEG